MGLFDGCLLACDVDDTLMVNNTVPQRNLEKIQYFTDEGGIFSVSTGRSPDAISVVLEQLKTLGPSVFGNGVIIYNHAKNETLFELFLPEEAHQVVKEITENFDGIGIEIHSGIQCFSLCKNDILIEHQQYEHMKSVAVSLEEAEKYHWNKVFFGVRDDAQLAEFKAYVSEHFPNSFFIYTIVRLNQQLRRYVELIPYGVSKATAVKELVRLMQVQPGGYYAIGDYYNDAEMLAAADVSAVPKEAPADLQAQVDYVCCAAKEGAVADFIDHLTALKSGK